MINNGVVERSWFLLEGKKAYAGRKTYRRTKFCVFYVSISFPSWGKPSVSLSSLNLTSTCKDMKKLSEELDSVIKKLVKITWVKKNYSGAPPPAPAFFIAAKIRLVFIIFIRGAPPPAPHVFFNWLKLDLFLLFLFGGLSPPAPTVLLSFGWSKTCF